MMSAIGLGTSFTDGFCSRLRGCYSGRDGSSQIDRSGGLSGCFSYRNGLGQREEGQAKRRKGNRKEYVKEESLSVRLTQGHLPSDL